MRFFLVSSFGAYPVIDLMEPTFTTGQVVFYLNQTSKQYFPAIITEVIYEKEDIRYKLEVQSGTGHALRSEETLAFQDCIFTFIEFTEILRQESITGSSLP